MLVEIKFDIEEFAPKRIMSVDFMFPSKFLSMISKEIRNFFLRPRIPKIINKLKNYKCNLREKSKDLETLDPSIFF